MTSGDTHGRTQKLLQDNAYFGMQPAQVTLLKQEKVRTLASCLLHRYPSLEPQGKVPGMAYDKSCKSHMWVCWASSFTYSFWKASGAHAAPKQKIATHQHLTMLREIQVACLSDSEAHLAVDKDNPFKLQTKPHGHGDVHSLLYGSGLLKKWVEAGVKWVAFFQDTQRPCLPRPPSRPG